MSRGRNQKVYQILDTTLDERIVWDAEFDDIFYCCVSRFSEDLYCLSIEIAETGQFVVRDFFSHQGSITPDLINSWKKHVEFTMDQHYECNYEGS